MRHLLIIVSLCGCSLFNYANSACVNKDSLFSQLAFGKGISVFSIGGGAIKRYIDPYYFDKDIREYYKSPSFSFSADHCFYPTASNAYLGIGPFLNGWVARKVYTEGGYEKESIFYNLLLSAKLSHHTSYFVTKHLDICSGYILGVNLRQYKEQNTQTNQQITGSPKTTLTPAIGITLTVRYYFNHVLGMYAEGGVGYKLNILNVGLCFKFKKY